MAATIIIIIFVLGYLAIAFEHPLRLNKAASALIIGVLCWTVYIVQSGDTHVSKRRTCRRILVKYLPSYFF